MWSFIVLQTYLLMSKIQCCNYNYDLRSQECSLFSCINFVRGHRHHLGHSPSPGQGDKYQVQLSGALNCLHLIHCMKWKTKRDIVLRTEEAVMQSVQVCEWKFAVVIVVTNHQNDLGMV